jgi:hypothetical protein
MRNLTVGAHLQCPLVENEIEGDGLVVVGEGKMIKMESTNLGVVVRVNETLV